jgi:hypothetical protein
MIMVMVKLKLSLCLTKYHAMKTYWRSWSIAPRILNLGTRWRWVVSFTPRPFYPRWKKSWYLFDMRLGVPQSRSGRGGEEKKSQPLPGIEPHSSSPWNWKRLLLNTVVLWTINMWRIYVSIFYSEYLHKAETCVKRKTFHVSCDKGKVVPVLFN